MFFGIAILLTLTSFGWCSSVCPDIPEYKHKLDSETSRALEKEQFYSEDCFLLANEKIKSVFENMCPWTRHGLCSFSLPDFSPCGNCKYDPNQMGSIHIDDGVFVEMYSESTLWNVTASFQKPITLQCDNCILQDEQGKESVGSIEATWTKPRLNLIVTYIGWLDVGEERETKVNLVNVTNADSASVQVTCVGDSKYKASCLKAKEIGLLYTVVRIAVEQFFGRPEDEDYMGQYDIFIGQVKGGVPEAFKCDKNDLFSEIIPASQRIRY